MRYRLEEKLRVVCGTVSLLLYRRFRRFPTAPTMKFNHEAVESLLVRLHGQVLLYLIGGDGKGAGICVRLPSA